MSFRACLLAPTLTFDEAIGLSSAKSSTDRYLTRERFLVELLNCSSSFHTLFLYRRVRTRFFSIRTSRYYVTGSDEQDGCVSRLGSGAMLQHGKHKVVRSSTSLIQHSPVVTAQNVSTTVLDPAKSPAPFSIHAKSPIVPAVRFSQSQHRETVPSLGNEVVSINHSHVKLPIAVVSSYSGILPSTEFSNISQSPPKMGSDENFLPPPKPSVTTAAQAGLQLNPQANIGQTITQGVKRRLGMGRSGAGYSNKKFKSPT